MTIHRFSDASLIKEVTYHRSEENPPVALLAANDSTNDEQVALIRRTLESAGMECVPTSVNGKDILQIRGFEKAEDLDGFLGRNGFIIGTPIVTSEGRLPSALNVRNKSQSFLQHYSLQMAGILNLIGDVGLFISGFNTKDPVTGAKKKDPYIITGGSFYTLGGANLALFGGSRPEEDVRVLTEDTARFIKNKIGHLPEDSSLSSVDALRQRDTLSDTLYHNAAQNTLGVYTAGAGAMLGSGIQQYRKDPKEFATLGYGISSLVFKVASFMIPEKSKKESNGRNRGLLGGIVDWVREKPLRLFGWGSVITDSFLAVDAYKKYKHTPKESGNYVWKATTAATYIVADLLIAISSKDHANASGKLDADGQRRILAMAAEAIIREPQATRDSLTFEIAEFLATQPNVSGTAAELDKAIQEQLTQLGKNRWAQRAVASQEAAADTAQQPGR